MRKHTFFLQPDIIELNDGDVLNLRTAEGLSALSKTAGAIDGAIQVSGARVFSNGWNRNFVRLKAGSLSKYAKTAHGTPVLFEHDPSKVLGVSGRMWAEKSSKDAKNRDVLRQNMQLTSPLARKVLGLGIRPRYSIALMELESTSYMCSECGGNMMNFKDCEHWPGQKVGGATVFAEMTSAEHAETTITFTPAVPDTEPGEIEMSLSFAEQIKRFKSINFQEEEEEEEEETEAEEEEAEAEEEETEEDEEDEEEEEDEMEDLKSRVRALEKLLLESERKHRATKSTFAGAVKTMTDKLEMLSDQLMEANRTIGEYRLSEDQAEVRKWRRQKALKGSESEHLEQFQTDREGFRRIMSSIPDSILTKQVSGVSPQPRIGRLTNLTSVELDQEASRLAKSTGKPWQECWAELRNRQMQQASDSRHKG
jgi:hypothetical protein